MIVDQMIPRAYVLVRELCTIELSKNHLNLYRHLHFELILTLITELDTLSSRDGRVVATSLVLPTFQSTTDMSIPESVAIDCSSFIIGW